MNRSLAFFLLLSPLVSLTAQDLQDGFLPLFPKDVPPEGWVVRSWVDLKKTPASNVVWRVENGVLHSDPRGTWLISEKD